MYLREHFKQNLFKRVFCGGVGGGGGRTVPKHSTRNIKHVFKGKCRKSAKNRDFYVLCKEKARKMQKITIFSFLYV